MDSEIDISIKRERERNVENSEAKSEMRDRYETERHRASDIWWAKTKGG